MKHLGRIWIFCFLLAACASYNPLPLDTKPHLAASLQELLHSSSKNSTLSVDPAKPLTQSDVVALAIRFNPDLQSARNDHAIAQAQMLQASLLPNPQFNGSYAFLLGGQDFANAVGLGLAEDIRALIVRGAQRKSAQYDAQKVDADLLWQEWQLAGKARLLYVDVSEMEKLRHLLQRNHTLLADRYAHDRHALAQGNLGLTTTAPDLAALSDVDKQLTDIDKQLQTKWHELDALLDLSPEVRFSLSPDAAPVKMDYAKATDVISRLPQFRPDLTALRLGYQAQEERVRAAILGQFPAMVFGGSWSSDTADVRTAGPVVTFDLPIFNRNQGVIAAERATRKKLHDEYEARLNAAAGEITAMLDSHALLWGQYQVMRIMLLRQGI